MTDGPLIRLAGITKRFGSALAVDDVSLDLRHGEFFCLLGPSGCGKSTLLRLLAGFETPDAGRIELDGRDLVGTPPHRRPLNMMFQSYALFPHLTVAGNLAYGLRMAGGLARPDRAGRVREMLELAGLDGLGERYPAQLSGGQRQRVALARALARRPQVLLLDEPLAALDRALRERTGAELKKLQARLGTTFVVVTHDQGEALAMADRIGVMSAGRLVQVGTPRDLYDEPATRFVAEFLGDANILDGRVIGPSSGGLATVELEGGLRVQARVGRAMLSEGAAVQVAARPERLRIRDESPGAPLDGETARWSGTIEDLTYLGSVTTWRIRTDAGPVVRVAAPADGAEARWARGDRIGVSVPPGAAVVVT